MTYREDDLDVPEPFNPFAGHPRFDRINTTEPAVFADPRRPSVMYVAEAPAAVAGRKDDSGKLDVTLLFDDLPHALEGVAEVLQWAITKKQPVPYARGSWQGVAPFQPRYRAAMLRHVLNAAKASIAKPGTIRHLQTDAETGLLESAHVATDALFQLEMAIREQKGFK